MSNISLLGKWLPSENTSSPQTRKYARIMKKGLKMSSKQYRQTLSKLRKHINIVETHISEKNYEAINYSKLPSIAGMKYRSAFYRNDEERYLEFIDGLSKGTITVNAKTLYPHDIVSKIRNNRYHIDAHEIQLFESQWNALPNFIEGEYENSMVMADVSGSMSGIPMDVSIALAMYIAERNTGVYHNHFMTFSNKPTLQEIKGKDIVDKVNNLESANWDMNTDLEKSLLILLDVAKKNNVSVDDFIKKLYIISDMQFDRCVVGSDKVTLFDSVKEQYELAGYPMPEIVFWNVNAYANVPVSLNEHGVKLVSGYSPSILKNLLNNSSQTPYEFMEEVLMSERYVEIVI